MNRALLLLALGLCLTACNRTRTPVPIEAQCDAMCFVECKSTAKWNASPADPAAFDKLAGETVPALREETRQCDVHRKACVQCLLRLERHGVIFLNNEN
jgi:hypothetical protein